LSDPDWAPDFGPSELNQTAGATAVGAREFLIAYNINLNTTDRRYATEIAYELRERGRWKRAGNIDPFYYKGEVVCFPEDGTYPCGNCDLTGGSFEELAEHYREAHGGDLADRYASIPIDPENPSGPVFKDGRFRFVKGLGWVIEEYNRAQISLNLTNYKVSPPHEVLEAAREEARKRGIVITGSEIVGVIPYEAMRWAARSYLRGMRRSTGLPVPDLMETAVQSMGLREVSEFNVEDRVLGIPKIEGPLVLRPTFDFVDEVSRDTPAPGGGSVAALAGALGSALAAMVANLSIPKGEFDDQYDTLSSIAERGQAVKDALIRGVDDDTRAFDSVIEAMRMPKDTEEERETRADAMREGYKAATRVPLANVELCVEALRLCAEIAPLADPQMISDVGTAALLADAGARSAAYNVRINLPETGDETFSGEMRAAVEALLAESAELAGAITSEACAKRRRWRRRARRQLVGGRRPGPGGVGRDLGALRGQQPDDPERSARDAGRAPEVRWLGPGARGFPLPAGVRIGGPLARRSRSRGDKDRRVGCDRVAAGTVRDGRPTVAPRVLEPLCRGGSRRRGSRRPLHGVADECAPVRLRWRERVLLDGRRRCGRHAVSRRRRVARGLVPRSGSRPVWAGRRPPESGRHLPGGSRHLWATDGLGYQGACRRPGAGFRVRAGLGAR
jgi:glutamate formiminotransferase/formiminotetrahydrofolate cyclodeaminase